jgi:2-oxoglutarate dehydrogenase E1 component
MGPSYAHLGNLPLLESLYESYKKDTNSVDSSWRHFFEGMEFGRSSSPAVVEESADLRIYHLINAFRTYGHLMAKTDPLGLVQVSEPPELNLKNLRFSPEEMDKNFPTCGFLKEKEAPLRVLVEALRKTYCGMIGIEYMDLGNPAIEKWMQEKIEPYFELKISAEEKKQILQKLNQADLFENFIHTKYTGQKRFSLEGGETLIPMLAAIIEKGGEEEVSEVFLGMAHRGRLNVLANILNKSYSLIFHEFEDFYTPDLLEGTGDVKYHKGFSGSLKTRNKEIPVVLAANPSHLESVDPVVEGQARARQELKGNKERRKEVLPILIHGDAAVAGQGVVFETMQMSRLTGYQTGGTLHLVINNQIAFTTLPKDSRSTRYCTDLARAFGSPIFHVNAEDPEGCVAVAKLAIEMRQKFQCDVFIDLVCYRKYGHNESDEPVFTQPKEYQIIKSKKPVRQIYEEKLIQEGVLSKQEAQQIEEAFKQALQKELEAAKAFAKAPKSAQPCPPPKDPFKREKTAVEAQTLIRLAENFCRIPEGFQLHPKIQRLLKERLEMVHADPKAAKIDWGMGEHLAFATLLQETYHVRISGQDSRRGTFTQRHATWIDQTTHAKYFPLSHLSPKQGLFDVFNSHLSEYAVLGFEFGYTLSYPKSLVIWEAQYGDFANGAQIIVDQYLASSEQKWGLTSNLVLMLPHGYEGQGPEHSSGRMERYLQLCGEENMRIANCTTPAQLFHLLRRQALSETRKPLVIFTPKALLRHPQTVSSLSEFTQGTFEEILDDSAPPSSPKKLLLCCGKVFYDLLIEREKRKASAAIVRIEQLYPFNEKKLIEIFQRYPSVEDLVWVQEEHSNMGAWEYLRPHLQKLFSKVRYAGRERSAAAAAGSHALHKKQYTTMMDEAFKERF